MNLAALFSHETDLLDLATDGVLFKEGDPGQQMFILISGTLQISVHNKIVEVAEPGAVVGEMSMIDEGIRSATVTAKTDCKLLAIDQKRFNFMVQETPNFAVHIMKVIARRLRNTDRLV